MGGGTDAVLDVNSRYESIRIMVEVGGSRINFLDLGIEVGAHGHKFSIYRKNTASDRYIDRSSFCHSRQKEAPYMWLIYRLVTVPLAQADFDRELNTIKTLAKCNGIRLNIDWEKNH